MLSATTSAAVVAALAVTGLTTAPAAPTVGSAAAQAPVVRIERVPIVERALTAEVGGDSREIATTELATDDFNVAAVTWDGSAEGHLSAMMRVRTAAGWTRWLEVNDDHHAPDPGTDARAGTEPFVTEAADAVEVRVVSEPGERLPDDLQLEVIDPGTAASDVEVAALTGAPADAAALAEVPAPLARAEALPPGEEPLALADLPPDVAEVVAAAPDPAAFALPPRPVIRSRAAWGADETLRRNHGKSVWYGTVKGAFVHHTAGTNTYGSADVPRLIRGIYHYHVVSREFTDIGYNFLVDRFGRIWEGAHGGVDKAVVGAHTQYYNSSSFSLSVMGDYSTKEPEAAVLEAYKQLFAWKLVLHGVTNPLGTAAYTYPGSRPQPVIAGHRDTKSTACPGQRLYDRLNNIRAGTAARIAAATAHLTLSGPAAVTRGHSADLTVTWRAGPLPVTGDVDLQRLDGQSWTTVRRIPVVDGLATTTITPGSTNTYRVRAVTVTAPRNVSILGDTGSSAAYLVSLVTGTVVPPERACTAEIMADDGFVDTSRFEAEIACIRHWRIAAGTSPTQYSPWADVTRGQMAAFVARLITMTGGSLPREPGDAFSDDTGSGFEREINQLAAAGIVGGTGRDSFSPDRVVTRAQMAAFLVRAYDYRAAQSGLEALPAGPDAFPDDASHGLRHEIDTAAAAGLVAGNLDGTYRPDDPVRRDHMAAFITRTLDLVTSRGMALIPPGT